MWTGEGVWRCHHRCQVYKASDVILMGMVGTQVPSQSDFLKAPFWEAPAFWFQSSLLPAEISLSNFLCRGLPPDKRMLAKGNKQDSNPRNFLRAVTIRYSFLDLSL